MTPPADHPPIPAPKIGVLLINLGTPDAPEPRRGAALSRANSCPIRGWSRSRSWSGSRSCTASSCAPGRRSRRMPIARSGPTKARRSPRSPRARRKALAGAFGAGRDRRSCDALRPARRSPSGSTRSRRQGCERILIAPLYPQYCAATTATANDAAFGASARACAGSRRCGRCRLIMTIRAYIAALKASVDERSSPRSISSRRRSSPASTACRSGRWSSAIPIIAIARRPRGCSAKRWAAS